MAPEIKPVASVLRVILLATVYGLFGGGLALRAYFSEGRRFTDNRRRQELDALRTQKQQADLRLGLLQAQVEPHFLFNTLASVRALVRQDPAQAEATLDALVDHLRATIPKLRDGEAMLHSTLGQQLDICASYLALMKLRMGGRLSYAVEAEASLRQQAFPPLLLITLVENAIKHGIEPQPGPGRVEVRASVKGERLVVSVVDDGAGLQPGLGSGVGLANVRDQLATRFGDRATLSLRGLPGRGAVAEIQLPLEPAA
ncbi:sensor histidine kinase [Arenimonas daejeonensis]|uniref:sensor histidine kinase n=1 Tax=Arenimonas daejeonensis TaxID=370777 RepID=UPI0011BE8624|nr:histidine kinase [Arenimonas daejeonensis]